MVITRRKEHIDEMAEVLEYAKERGIDLGGVIFGQTKAELYEDEEDKKAEIVDQGEGTATGEEGEESGEESGSETVESDDEGARS